MSTSHDTWATTTTSVTEANTVTKHNIRYRVCIYAHPFCVKNKYIYIEREYIYNLF
jgi:hypothetical protein